MAEGLLNLTDDSFEEQVVKSEKPFLVDFSARWCAPCRAIEPIIKNIAEEYSGKVQIGKMDIDDHPKTASNYSVRAIPTILLFVDGNVVEQVVGLVNKEKLTDMIEKHM